MLRDLDTRRRYRRTSSSTIMDDFLVPRLSLSNHYDRITGYFSASTFVGAAEGFNGFINNDNPKYRIITGAKLIPDEKELLWTWEDIKNKEKIEQKINLEIDEMINEVNKMGSESKDRLRNFSYLLKENILEMKVAIMIDKDTGKHIPHSVAEFHEKIGILSDGENTVAFTGGVNESWRGWHKNGDSITIFCDWENGQEKFVDDFKNDFEELWKLEEHDKSLGVVVYDLPSDSAQKLIETFPPLKPGENYSGLSNEVPQNLPFRKTVQWYNHQIEAEEWFCNKDKANGIGIFEMATGSGKTWTAMRCMERLFEEGRIDSCVISVPKTLIPQWKKELNQYLEMFSDGGLIRVTYEYSGSKKQNYEFEDNNRSNTFIIVSHSMLKKFLGNLNLNQGRMERTFLIIDELHNIGTDKFRDYLREKELQLLAKDTVDFSTDLDIDDVSVDISENENVISRFGYRLGLSATPWSHYDEENTRNSFLINNFTRFDKIQDSFFDSGRKWQKKLMDGGFTFNFGLKQGIENNILAEFDYIPLYYKPTEEEIEEYNDLVKKGFGHKDEEGKNNPLGAIRAAAVFKSSINKIECFLNEIKKKNGKLNSLSLSRTLIFVETTEFGKILQKELINLGYDNFNSYFMNDKKINLEDFAKGETDFLVSCHRLSEGIDIKTVNQIILFSSSGSPLETIQRIGRSLRKNTNQMKTSTVIDFIFNEISHDIVREAWLKDLALTRGNKGD